MWNKNPLRPLKGELIMEEIGAKIDRKNRTSKDE